MLGGAAGGPAAAMQPRPPDQFPPTAGARGAQVAPRPRWRTGVLRPTTTDDILLHRSVSASARPLFPFGLAGAADDAVASMGGGCRRRPALTGRLAAMVGLENQRHRNLHLGAGVAASVTWSSSYSLGGGPPTSLDVVLRHMQDDAWADAEVLQDDAWAAATAVAESGHVNYEDEAEVFEWAAHTAAAMRYCQRRPVADG